MIATRNFLDAVDSLQAKTELVAKRLTACVMGGIIMTKGDESWELPH